MYPSVLAAKRRNMMSAFAGSADIAIADPDVAEVPTGDIGGSPNRAAN